jgi:hypothetical protein
MASIADQHCAWLSGQDCCESLSCGQAEILPVPLRLSTVVTGCERPKARSLRFSYLIEKARGYAATLQSFGGALFSALERKDAEELNRLRIVHQQRLLRLTTQMRRDEIKTAQEALDALGWQKEAITYRRNYYQGLVASGRTPAEFAQSVARHTASAMYTIEATLGILAGVLTLLPQLGAPTAMKYGGVEVGGGLARFGLATRSLAAIAEAVGASAGLEASFERREQGWKHQVELADNELNQIERQIEAAKIRKQIAERAAELHERSIEQLEEIFDTQE